MGKSSKFFNKKDCACASVIMILALFFILFAPAAGWGVGGKGTGSTSTGGSPVTQLSGIPAGWNQIIQEASKKIDVPPLMVASIFLTEHHITSFGADINPSGVDANCAKSYAGARGPWQLMPGWWYGADAALVKYAATWGLTVSYNGKTPFVDVCNYKAAAIGGAYAIKTKMNNAGIKKGYTDSLTDAEIQEIAKRYCGCCDCKGCGNANFSYCGFTLERYKALADLSQKD